MFQNLPLEKHGIQVEDSGCLGECGSGPNLVVDDGRIFRGITSSKIAAVLHVMYGLNVDERTLLAIKLKREGNAALGVNDLREAIQRYTEGLALGAPDFDHVLLANRSAAHLLGGAVDAAVEDALASIACSPPSYVSGYVRLAAALSKQGKYRDAIDTLRAACEKDPAFGKTPSYRVEMQLL